MLRVNIVDSGVVERTAHFKDGDLKAARAWVRPLLERTGKFATFYRCQDEHSPSVEFLGELIFGKDISLCDSCGNEVSKLSRAYAYICECGNYPSKTKNRCKYYTPYRLSGR